MTKDNLPENVLLAVAEDHLTGASAPISKMDCRRIAAEIATLRAGYDAARLEVESLHAQLEAIGAGGVEPLRRRECLHQISEPAARARLEEKT